MSVLKNAKETLSIISKRTCEYLQDDMSLDIENNSITLDVLDSCFLETYTALINLKYDMDGTIGLSASTSLAYFLVEHFMCVKVNDNELEELAGESVAEILNIILGNVIQDFAVVKNGGQVDISTPFIIDNTAKIAKTKKGLMIIGEINTNHGKLILTYFS